MISLLMRCVALPVETLAMDVCTHRNNVNCAHLVPSVDMYMFFSCKLCVIQVCACEFLSSFLHVFPRSAYSHVAAVLSGPDRELDNFRDFRLN